MLVGLLTGVAPTATLAGSALIETTAPLADRSEGSIKAAVIAALGKAVRGAEAMGFAWFQLRDAQVAGDEVAVRILATDDPPSGASETEPRESPSTPDGDLTEEPVESTPKVPVPATPRTHI
jgi:hypothetical protein